MAERLISAPPRARADASSLNNFHQYVAELDALLVELLARAKAPSNDPRVIAHLDGGAGAALRRLVSLDVRRDAGAFFTPHGLASAAAAKVGTIKPGFRVVDPACGAGDLLLAAARRLPVRATVSETLRLWGESLAGVDADPIFITTAKRRLALLALSRGARADAQPSDAFPHLVVGDGATSDLIGRDGVHVLLNPPYGTMKAPAGCSWGSGSVARAAVFASDVIERCAPGARVVCILPDVLRSGTRYARWRGRIEALAQVESVEVAGRFDDHTDVDVFLLTLTRRSVNLVGPSTRTTWAAIQTTASRTIGEVFDVSVGSVVAYRSPKRGNWQRYLVAHGLANHVVRSDALSRRRFTGRLVAPPFVVVRRTSKPSKTASRVLANLVVGGDPVAVENHLVVLKPTDGRRSTCEQLLRVLRSCSTTELLDQRIRCRHLTVAAISELPWESE
jgi:hypothetical protein